MYNFSENKAKQLSLNLKNKINIYAINLNISIRKLNRIIEDGFHCRGDTIVKTFTISLTGGINLKKQ